MPAVDLSQSRHPLSDPQADVHAGPWYPAAARGADDATVRAGRPGGRPGVLASRSPARTARRTVRSGQSLASGEPRLTAAWCIGRWTTEAPAPMGAVLLERPFSYLTGNLQLNGPINRPWAVKTLKRRVGDTAWFRPFTGTPSASTRGKRTGGV
jgi:hypothetical protein